MEQVRPRPNCLRDLEQDGAVRETFHRLADARIVQVDHDALFRDFPWLAENRTRTAAEASANAWLLSNAAVVSTSQAVQQQVNSPIATDPDRSRRGIRLSGQGRSAYVEATGDGPGHGGILNIKGVGVAADSAPRREPQRNGLIPLHCALYEFIMHQLVAAAFRHAGAPHSVLPAYAVFDAGFDELDLHHEVRRPAGLLVRAASHRPAGGDLPRTGSILQRACAAVEFVLRHYGLTSGSASPWLKAEASTAGIRLERAGYPQVDPGDGTFERIHRALGGGDRRALDCINVQYTGHFDWASGGLELVDLHYVVRPRFANPVASTVSDRVLGLGSVLAADHPDFVQPSPELSAWTAPWLRRRPTAREARNLALDSGEPIEGGMLICLEAVERYRRTGELDPDFARALVASCVSTWS